MRERVTHLRTCPQCGGIGGGSGLIEAWSSPARIVFATCPVCFGLGSVRVASSPDPITSAVDDLLSRPQATGFAPPLPGGES